jgi:ABC-type multidrug transport system fused ATPase/permease subunit
MNLAWLGSRCRTHSPSPRSCKVPLAFAVYNNRFNLITTVDFSIQSYIAGLVWAFTETEKEMIAVERCGQYIDLESEENYHAATDTDAPHTPSRPTPLTHPPVLGLSKHRNTTTSLQAIVSDWQCTRGEVVFDGVWLRYRGGSNAALQNLSFSVRAGETIGVVGRTGAGKSSILQVRMPMSFMLIETIVSKLPFSHPHC